jgi:preprotein translocase subunit SecE
MSIEEIQSELPVAETPQGPIARLKNFYHETRLEMTKVAWPTRKEVIDTTMVVIVAVFFFGFFLFFTDIALK